MAKRCLADGVKLGARAIIRQAAREPGGFFSLARQECTRAEARQRNGSGRLEEEELLAEAMAGQRGNPNNNPYYYAGSNEVLRKYVGTSPLISRVAYSAVSRPHAAAAGTSSCVGFWTAWVRGRGVLAGVRVPVREGMICKEAAAHVHCVMRGFQRRTIQGKESSSPIWPRLPQL